MADDEADVSPAQLTHGARSEAHVAASARAHKRRLLRQIGLRAPDLDPIALGYLDLWARSMSKVSLYDSWGDKNGWLDADGNAPAFVATYMAAVNSARLALRDLERHLRQRGGEPSMVQILQGEARRVGP